MRSLKSCGGLTRGRGMTSSVRMLWVHSMHSCATVQNAMASLTDHFHNTSEQHVELGKSRIKLDFDELQHILQWFDSSSPFDINRTDLQSLSTGVVADETVNCDNAENVGSTFQAQLDGKSYTKTQRKRKDQVKTFGHLNNLVKVNKQKFVIDPSRFFTRLIVLLERSDDIVSYFHYELTHVPASLFSEDMMRKPNKALLIQSNLGKDSQLVDSSEIIQTNCKVVDGGALLRNMVWKQSTTFKDIVELYLKHVKSTYGEATIVFVGYGGHPSTKDHEHV